SALPHGNPSEQVLKQGDFVTLDFGAVVNGYRSDMTRSYIIGEASEKQTRIYNTVLDAQNAALEMVKPGINCLDLNAISNKVIAKAGFGEYAGKGLGHGLGLFLHEVPFINTLTDYNLEVGNVITIEPGIYIPGYGGVRLEDDIVITESGFEVLTHAPKPFII
ncbi:M24 family metallopeptidase, partial [uncultured Pseudoalteromonas sp.]|uniref:M24 family metallopeptidase n=1 Tax=uncultured Pseudoalteromonas sp. TaxID=114053 RepID=UPI002628A08E